MHLILSHTEPGRRTEGHVGLGTLDLFECDECGCVVSDPDIHMDRMHPVTAVAVDGTKEDKSND